MCVCVVWLIATMLANKLCNIWDMLHKGENKEQTHNPAPPPWLAGKCVFSVCVAQLPKELELEPEMLLLDGLEWRVHTGNAMFVFLLSGNMQLKLKTR